MFAPAHVFVDINTCLAQFTDIMLSSWFEKSRTEFVKLFRRDPRWLRFTSAFRSHYGFNAEEKRYNCALALNDIMMNNGDSIDGFIDRFNTLSRLAADQVLPNILLVEKFLSAIPTKTAKYVVTPTATIPAYKQTDVNMVSDMASTMMKNKLVIKFRSSSNSSGSGLVAPRAPKRQAVDIDLNDARCRLSN